MTTSDRRLVVFLDDDPAVRLVRALVSSPLPDAVRAWLPGYFWPEPAPVPDTDLVEARRTAGWPGDATGMHLADPASATPALRAAIEAIVFRRGGVDRALIDALPRLRVVQRFGTLAPEIDRGTADTLRARGIALCVFPRPSLASVAEHAIALLLAVRRRLLVLDDRTRSGFRARDDRTDLGPVTYNWTGTSAIPLVRGSRVGILGIGEIGVDLARLLTAFGAGVLYCNRRRLPPARELELGVEYRPLDALLSEADALVVTATPPADGVPVIGARELALMRPSAVLVNVARGSLIDESALATALARDAIAGAGLDVYAQEPLSSASPLARLPNVVLTPHVAGGTRRQLFGEATGIAANIAAALRGETPAYRVAIDGPP